MLPGPSFNAVEVERANDHPESICQIGIARVRNGRIVEVYATLVNPRQKFGWFHRRLHGIDAKRVRGKPSFQRIAGHVRRLLEGAPTVSHSMSDRDTINIAMERAGQHAIRTRWIDSIPIVQAAWPERYAKGSFGLANIAENSFDGIEDARMPDQIIGKTEHDMGVVELILAQRLAAHAESRRWPSRSCTRPQWARSKGPTSTPSCGISARPPASTTVDYRTEDDRDNPPGDTLERNAIAGSDYVATHGTLTFHPGETLKAVEVEVLADDHDEDVEEMLLVLSNARGARIDKGAGIGVIRNTGPIPKTWIARFGRTVADQVLDAVEARMRAARRPGVEVTLAGR